MGFERYVGGTGSSGAATGSTGGAGAAADGGGVDMRSDETAPPKIVVPSLLPHDGSYGRHGPRLVRPAHPRRLRRRDGGEQRGRTLNHRRPRSRSQIEQQFAVVCMEQAETYWNLITKLKPSTLARLTPSV